MRTYSDRNKRKGITDPMKEENFVNIYLANTVQRKNIMFLKYLFSTLFFQIGQFIHFLSY